MLYVIKDKRIKPDHMKGATQGANSVDLRACIDEPLRIRPDEQVIIETGIEVALPLSTIGMILPRSGKGSKGLVLGNLVGNIDPDYRGIVKVCLWNRGKTDHIIDPLERIAQFVVAITYSPESWTQAESLDETSRGAGGFGSTDVDLVNGLS